MKNLKKLRMERNLSQQALGDHFCISQQSIHKYENGYAEPDIETLIEFADFFHTSVDYLIGHTDNPNPENLNLEITFSHSDLHHLYMYQKLPPKIKQEIDALIKAFLESLHEP